MLPFSVQEATFTKEYRLGEADSPLKALFTQPAGARVCSLQIALPPALAEKAVWLQWGDSPTLGGEAARFKDGVALLQGLAPRGTRYWLLPVDGEGEALCEPFCVRAICRYPYGRSFMDSFAAFTQQFGGPGEIGYDLEYYTTSTPLEPVQRLLGETPAPCYLDHIVESVTAGCDDEMAKAKALWLFVGAAIQHNAMHMNLRETVPAMELFAADPACDLDRESMWLLELGHTRCGVINGFISAALLKRVGIQSSTIFGCGGHTIGKAFIQGQWRLWDVDAFKGVVPLDANGEIPPFDWVRTGENLLLLDTYPSWQDTPEEEGWLADWRGHRITGYVDGCRDHSETGYTSSWFGGEKHFPPSVPEPLCVAQRAGERVLLEWIGSYCREDNFRDYLVEINHPEGGKTRLETTETGLWVTLPQQPGYSFTVYARDWHGVDTPYFGRIHYSCRKPVEIPAGDVSARQPFMLGVPGPGQSLCERAEGFRQLEGFDNVLGQTRFGRTGVFLRRAGIEGKPLYQMQDDTNYLFNGCRVRCLFAQRLQKPLANRAGWQFAAVLRVRAYDMAGQSRFPLLWLGKAGSHVGVGIGLDCETGLVRPACNIMGDWRYTGGFEPRDYVRIDIVCAAGEKKLWYYADGELLAVEDYSMFSEGSFDVDMLYLANNPDAETAYLLCDAWVAPGKAKGKKE